MDHAEQIHRSPPSPPGPHLPWLDALRAHAQERFAAGGFPSPREEDWRYTNISAIEKRRFTPSTGEPIEIEPGVVERHRLPNADTLVFVDGQYSRNHSSCERIPENVIALPMRQALEQYPERIQPRLHEIAASAEHGFIAFNTAYFSDGVFLHVPADQVLTHPIQILHVNTRQEGMSVLRNLILIERNAEAQVVETFVGSEGTAALTAAVTEARIGNNAGLEHYKVQVESERTYHFGGLYVRQEPSARLHQHQSAFGGLLARTEVHTQADQGTVTELDGFFLAKNRQQLDTLIRVRHASPAATTAVSYRGIAADRGRGVFAGRIIVDKDAQKTDAMMNCRNLLLSEGAEIDSKPQLEIHADDVKCSHGVTVGQLDPQSVFYLQSRGIDEAAARNTLTFAFAHEAVEKIRLDDLRRLVQVELLAALPNTGIRGDWL